MARRPRIRSHIDVRGLPGSMHVHCVLEQSRGDPATLHLSLRSLRSNAEPPFTAPWGDWTEPAVFDSDEGVRRWLSLGLPDAPRRGECHVVELLVTARGARLHRRRFAVAERGGAWCLATARSAWRLAARPLP